MSPARGISIFFLIVATVLGIVALFLNIAVKSGLNEDQLIRLAELRATNRRQCNETQIILEMLSGVRETLENTTVDTMELPRVLNCEEYVRTRNPALMNASSDRLMELLEFNETVAPTLNTLWPLLNTAAMELNALDTTGAITEHQTGTVSVFQYSIRSIALGGSENYYIELPKLQNLLQVTMNMTSELLLDDWMPAIGSGCDNCTRVDLILDRQQEKIMTVPTPIMFDSRAYPNGTDVLLDGNADVMAGAFIGIADAVHLSF